MNLEHSHIIHRNELKWLQNLNIRHYTTKLLEEKRGKTFSDIQCSNHFLGHSPKVTEKKQNKQVGYNQKS